jgi:hypothetical protein
MMATNFTHDDCLVGRKRRSYAALQREYCCAECGGRIVVRYDDVAGWHPECGRCGRFDFIHEAELDRQQAEATEVLDVLPAGLVATLIEKGE